MSVFDGAPATGGGDGPVEGATASEGDPGRALAAAQAQIAQLEALVAVGRVASLGFGHHSGAALLAAIRKLRPVDAVAIGTAGHHDRGPRALAAYAICRDDEPLEHGLQWLTPAANDRFQELTVRDLRSVDPSHSLPAVAAATGLRRLAAVPLRFQDERLGTLILLARDPAALTDADRALLQVLADQVVPAVRTALLTEEIVTRAERSAALAELARIVHSSLQFEWVLPRLARALEPILAFDCLTVSMLVEAHDQDVVRFRLHDRSGEWSTGQTTWKTEALPPDDPLRSGTLLWAAGGGAARGPASDAAWRRLASVIGVPVIGRMQVIAALTVESGRPGCYHNGDLQLLEQVAAVLGPAVENVRLFRQLSERSEWTDLLRRVARAAANGPRIEDFFAEFCAHVHQLVPYRAVSLTVADEDDAAPRCWTVRPAPGTFALHMRYLEAGEQAEFQALVMGDGQPPPARAAQRRAFPLEGARPALFLVERDSEPAFSVREVDTLREAVAVLSVAAETDRMYAIARRAADSDGLTGLTNHARLWQDLKREIARSRRRSLACSVLILDIDGFKGINDSHGHAEGDRTLQRVAAMLRDVMRSTDIVGRVGGDEFSVLLPETDSAQARLLCRRLLRAAAATDADLAPLSLSIGIATFPSHGDTAETLVRCADLAMYAAKRAGGGHFLLWKPGLAQDGMAAASA